MDSTWRGLIARLLVTVLVSLVVFAAASPFLATTALGATSTSFSPAAVSLPTGQSTTITIAAVGLAAGATAGQFGIVHTANTRISNPACAGVFASANMNQATQPSGDLLACTFASGGASGTSGNVMTFTLTNTGGGNETISFNATSTFYLNAAFTTDPAGTLNTLTVTAAAATSTPPPTLPSTPTLPATATPVVIATATLIPTPTTVVVTPTPPRTATPTLANAPPPAIANTPLPAVANAPLPALANAPPNTALSPPITAPSPPNSGTLLVCTSTTIAGMAAATFAFTTPGGSTIPSITVPAGQVGPLCGASVAVAAGPVAVGEVVPAGFALQSVAGGTLAGNTATATIAPGQTTTLTFIHEPTTGIPPPQALPPLQFLPSAPPQFLPSSPPPAVVPPLTAAAPSAPGAPIIPEGDSAALLAVGLAAIGGLAVLRRWKVRRAAASPPRVDRRPIHRV
jgi:hypothetical protein